MLLETRLHEFRIVRSRPLQVPSRSARFSVEPEAVARVLAIAILLIVSAHLATQVARFAFDRGTLMGLTTRLYLGAEASLPAWFSSSVLLACAVMLALIARLARNGDGRRAGYWALLSLVFLFLSADESAQFHELTSTVFAGTMTWLAQQGGAALAPFARSAPRYAWILPGVAVTAVIGLASLRFLRSLPRRTALLFVAAGTLFVGGAVGFEAVGGWYSGAYGADNPVFVAVMTVEETLEMVGASLFLYALVAYLRDTYANISVAFAPGNLQAAEEEHPRRRLGDAA